MPKCKVNDEYIVNSNNKSKAVWNVLLVKLMIQSKKNTNPIVA